MTDGYELTDRLLGLNHAVDQALYHANRYQKGGYEHQKQKAVGEVESVKELAEEILEEFEEGDNNE